MSNQKISETTWQTAGSRARQPTEIRVLRREIDERAPSPLSVMPQGLEKTVSPAEMADLVAFLRSLK